MDRNTTWPWSTRPRAATSSALSPWLPSPTPSTWRMRTCMTSYGASRRVRSGKKVSGSRLPEILHQHQVRLALIHSGVQNVLAVGRDRKGGRVAQIEVFHAINHCILAGSEVVKRDRHATRIALELHVIDTFSHGLHRGGPQQIVVRDDGLLLFAAIHRHAPEGAPRAEVDILAIGRFDRLRRAPLLRQRLRVAALRGGFPDLPAGLEVNPA